MVPNNNNNNNNNDNDNDNNNRAYRLCLTSAIIQHTSCLKFVDLAIPTESNSLPIPNSTSEQWWILSIGDYNFVQNWQAQVHTRATIIIMHSGLP